MNLLKPLTIISLMTIFSRILGFLRDIIIAKIFGADILTDAFFAAFKLPNLLRRIFAEGAFSQSFVPILTKCKSEQSKDEIREFISYIFGLLALTLIVITIVGILLAPWIIMVTVPGFVNTSIKFELTTQLLRITFPYILLISLVALVGSVLNTWNYFLVPAFTPALLNISIISFILFTVRYFNPPVFVLAWSVITGGFLQLAYQLPYLKKIDMLVFPKINLRDLRVIKVIKQMTSAILGVSASQISMIINNIFASFLVSGSISWMYYAERLIEFPSGILGMALGTVLLQSLSKSFVNGNYHIYHRLIDWGLRLCLLIALPSAVALGILAKPLTISLFQYGKFNSFDSLMTQRTLIAYSIGLIGIILVKILSLGFYSRQDIKTPVRIAIFTLLVTQIMNLIFIKPLKHVGISLSISLAAYLNATLLYWQLRKRRIFIPQPGWLCFLKRLVVSLLAMIIAILGMLYLVADWSIGTMIYRINRLAIVVLIGTLTYFIMLKILGFKMGEFKIIFK